MQMTQVGDYVVIGRKASDFVIANAKELCRQQADSLGAVDVDIFVKRDFEMLYFEGSIMDKMIVDLVSWKGYIYAENSGEVK